MKYVPQPVYDYLPTIYVIAGGLLAANFDVGIGKVASMVLLFAGVVVFNMRLNARSKTK